MLTRVFFTSIIVSSHPRCFSGMGAGDCIASELGTCQLVHLGQCPFKSPSCLSRSSKLIMIRYQ